MSVCCRVPGPCPSTSPRQCERSARVANHVGRAFLPLGLLSFGLNASSWARGNDVQGGVPNFDLGRTSEHESLVPSNGLSFAHWHRDALASGHTGCFETRVASPSYQHYPLMVAGCQVTCEATSNSPRSRPGSLRRFLDPASIDDKTAAVGCVIDQALNVEFGASRSGLVSSLHGVNFLLAP